jgi:hypothetical protein
LPRLHIHVLITPIFPFGFSLELVEDYVMK